jgi:hypothetical protein
LRLPERAQTTQETVVKEKRRSIPRQTMAAGSGDETEALTLYTLV